MRQAKSILTRSLFLLLIVSMFVAFSVKIYQDMVEIETEDSWDRIQAETESMASLISLRFTDHLNMLDYIADAVSLIGEGLESPEALEYLRAIQNSPGTLFDRIDIVFPNGMQLCQDGNYYEFIGIDGFEAMASRGTHISPRLVDDQTGRESLYCGAPIIVDGEIIAILMGMIDCQKLSQQFLPSIYNGESQVFLIDCQDGSYLIDLWHDELGNVSDLGDREMLPDYEGIDMSEEILSGKNGKVGFVSKTTGKDSFQTHHYIPEFNWTLCIMAQEDEIFQSVFALRQRFFYAGIIEAILLMIYFVWSIRFVLKLAKNEQKLRIADMEKAKNEAKSVFLSTVSHDIRTPLNGIIGMLNVIHLHEDVPPKTRDSLKKIETSAYYLETLVNDVLDLNDIENSHLDLSNDVIDIHTFTDRINTLTQPNAERYSVEFSTELKNIAHPKIHCSLIHVQRVILNLISNSIKYNKKGGYVRLTVEETAFDNGETTYVFTVKDNGIGMTESFQQHMFDAFEQEYDDNARTENKGHGLGLPIVKKLVEKMNGTIDVVSQKDLGTTFTVTLKFLTENALSADSDKADKDVQADITGVKILLVEDNVLNMEIADTLLSDAGAVITPATNGKLAVEEFEKSSEHYFDIILMDIMMPEMDGIEATRIIRDMKRADSPKIPILAMTAGTFADDVKKCFNAGMTEHIGKPLDMDSLIIKIAEYKKIYDKQK